MIDILVPLIFIILYLFTFNSFLGILYLLNEICHLPKGSDNLFLMKIKKQCNDHIAFSTQPLLQENFSIKHYAGNVSYNSIGFVECNKDNLSEDLRHLLADSSNYLISSLFGSTAFLFTDTEETSIILSKNEIAKALLLTNSNDDDESTNDSPMNSPMKLVLSQNNEDSINNSNGTYNPNTGTYTPVPSPLRVSMRRNKASFMMADTVVSKFKNQLINLMETIGATEVQYVRCIKPNAEKSSVIFNRSMVVEQLRSAGMIEAITISRSAYPNHLSYEYVYSFIPLLFLLFD